MFDRIKSACSIAAMAVMNGWRALSLREKVAVAKEIEEEVMDVKGLRSAEKQSKMAWLGGEHEYAGEDNFDHTTKQRK